MKKVGINYRSKLGAALVEGERLELKIDRMTQNTISDMLVNIANINGFDFDPDLYLESIK